MSARVTSGPVWAEAIAWHEPAHRAVMASVKLGAWMSAALEDPKVCDAMKADIEEWFSAGEPMELLSQGLSHYQQATAELVEALREARTFIDTEPALNDHPCPGVNCGRCKRRHAAFTKVNAALSRHTEPTDAELLDQVCRSADEALKPLPFESSDAPESAGARATEPSERGE